MNAYIFSGLKVLSRNTFNSFSKKQWQTLFIVLVLAESVMKYPQALAVLNYLHQHNQPLSTKIFIPKEALLDDTYSPLRDKYPEGNIYIPIDQLLDYTIQKSDNK